VDPLGKGATSSYSRKVKTNTRSLTETQLLAEDMFMPAMLWLQHFIQAQGYEVECIGLYQDNINLQLLIKNGKMSSGKKTKHIKSKFFFIKDKVDNGEIKVIDCPREEMWADVMTMLLQETVFRVMQAEMMNCPVNYEGPAESQEKKEKKRAISAPKRVTWKIVLATPFKTPQECIGQNRNRLNKPRMDRHLGRIKFPRGNSERSVRVARLPRMTWQVGV
jgi:hypothetical protein